MAAATLMLSPGLFAQLRSSTIVGTVTDSSGAAVPAAEITVREQRTNITYDFRTNEVGQYTVPYLPAGLYSVTVKKEGFKAVTKSDVPLETAATIRVDFELEVGQVETTVTVEASGATLQTDTAVVQGTVGAQLIQSIPNI
jgi:hypothetical protein